MPVYLIGHDASWAAALEGLLRGEGLAGLKFFPAGKGALAGYRQALPDVVIFDLRVEHHDVSVAMSMIREAFPRMAAGGVMMVGAADPADRQALREEREQLARIQLAEYLPRNTPDDFLIERVLALHQRAQEYRRQSREATPPQARRPETAPPEAPLPPTDPAPPCRLHLLISQPELQAELLRELADLGAAALPVGPRPPTEPLEHVVVDSTSAEQHAGYLTQLHRRQPGLRILQAPDPGAATMRRLSHDVSALLKAPGNGAGSLAEQIRARVAGDGRQAAPILLLVEDEQSIRELAAHYLLLQGFEVHQAEDGSEALAILQVRRPDLIISDVYMPRMNGFKLLLEVRNRDPELPVLMMSGYSSATQVLGFTNYRKVAFLNKPFRLSDLGERVRGLLELQS
ncbi:MAG: response regulator [bacterium]|nr:response regulator [bacterium]